MQNRFRKFLKLHWSKFLLVFLFVLLFSAYGHIFARDAKYSPGQTLNPTDCSPGEENCTVEIGGGGSSLWATSGSDIYYNGGNVGIGTNTPTSVLDIKLDTLMSHDLDDGGVTGVNDADFSGGNSPGRVYFSIDGIGSPNTFSYYPDGIIPGCSYTSNVPITGSPQSICDGISVTFASTTGHTISDTWIYYTNNGLASTNPIFKISNNGDSYFSINAVAPDSIFLGTGAGGADFNATNSNFLGNNAGNGATGAHDSNFLGKSAGSGTSGQNLNFLGFEAGLSSTADSSNFMGPEAGSGATGIGDSNFLGPYAGKNASQVYSSTFLTNSAGSNSSNISSSNFFGQQAGQGATGVTSSNFFGMAAGMSATNASNSNFLGDSAGLLTSASSSNFLGYSAGKQATSASSSNFLGAYAGQHANDASYSNFMGFSAGSYATGASNSNFLGYNAGISATGASNSNFLGNSAGYVATNASNSNFLGDSAGLLSTNASYSNFIGYNAGVGATEANNSIFIGTSAGSALYVLVDNYGNISNGATNASNSIFIGQEAGYQDTVNNSSNGLSSILIGSFTNTGSFSNSILLGSGVDGSPISNTKANQFMLAPTITEMRLRGIDYTLPADQGGANTVLTNDGSGVLTWTAGGGGGSGTVTSVSVTTANGVSGSVTNATTTPALTLTLGAITPTSVNGLPLSQDNTDFNVKVGQDAGLNLVVGAQYNTFLGYEAGMSVAVGGTNGADNNTAIGSYSLYSNTTGSANTANGMSSLSSNTTGSNNTANGYQSLHSNTTGYQNTANGFSSLRSNTTGYQNTANGYQSLAENTTGFENIANGYFSLLSNTTGSQNTANGNASLQSNTEGWSNIANGYQSLFSNTTGSQNTANGYASLANNTAGVANIGLGYYAGRFISGGIIANTTGNFNIFLGSNTKALADNEQNEIVIGYNATGNGSNTTTIGTGNVLYVGGTGIGTNSKVARFTNNSGYCDITPVTGGVSCSSDMNLKGNIMTLDDREFALQTIPTGDIKKTTLEKIMEITPVNYNWNAEIDYAKTHEDFIAQEHIGFIAQEMEQIFPSIVSTDTKGTFDPKTGKTNYLKSISYASITPYLVKAIQEMNLKIEEVGNMEKENIWRTALTSWFGNAGNKITRIFTGEICLTDEGGETECINRSELKSLKNLINSGVENSGNTNIKTPPVVIPPVVTPPSTPIVVTPPANNPAPALTPEEKEAKRLADLEIERLANEKATADKAEADRLEAERLAKEAEKAEADRLEAERIANEKAAAAELETEKKAEIPA